MSAASELRRWLEESIQRQTRGVPGWPVERQTRTSVAGRRAMRTLVVVFRVMGFLLWADGDWPRLTARREARELRLNLSVREGETDLTRSNHGSHAGMSGEEALASGGFRSADRGTGELRRYSEALVRMLCS
jgi:hypothetical protein